MRVLVFGRNGQVATELAVQAPPGVLLTPLGRNEVDLARPDECARFVFDEPPDMVINAAAFTAVDEAEKQEELATLVNCEAPRAMARSCAALGIPLLHLSTDYVFDGTGTDPRGPDALVMPVNAYGRSKCRGEDAVRSAGGPYVILRTSWVVSAHGKNFIKTMLRLSQTREVLSVVADQVGGPTPAADIARALWTISGRLQKDLSKSGTYHYSGWPDVSWAEFAREIFRQSNLPVHVENILTEAYETVAERPLNSRLDCSATLHAFGLCRPDWRVGLSRILDRLKDEST